MSLNTETDRVAARIARPWSLATRLTAWYAASAFALVLAACWLLYLALVRSLNAENQGLLADRIADIRGMLRTNPDALRELAADGQDPTFAHHHTPVYVRVFDDAGNVVAETRGMGAIFTGLIFPDAIDVTAKAGPGAIVRADNGQRYHLLTARARPPAGREPAGASPYTVHVALDMSSQEKLLADYRQRLWITMTIALILCIGVGYEIARRGIKPTKQITQTARHIQSTTLGQRINAAHMPAELRSLAAEFNQMLDRLQESFARISRFSADIAHELRTPVNNLRGVAEVALTRARSREEYHEALSSTVEECVRLSHIIENLLFLARAEDPKHQVAREPLDVGHELRTVAEFYEASASEAGVRIDVRVDQPIHAELNRTLMQRAVGNVLDNSIRHTPAGGTITLSASRDNGSLRIDVSDTGHGIPAEHLPRIFDRLYRVHDDRSTQSGGAGLGLAIVQSIAASHGGTAEISSNPGEGTRVRIELPV